MTIAIAIPCTDGILLASDSMGHAARIATKIKKVQVAEPHRASVASSGSEFMNQAAIEAIQQHPAELGSTPLELAEVVCGVLQRVRSQPLPASKVDSESPHQLELLVAGWSDDGPSLVIVPADLAVVECTHKPFVAIGSGSDFAHVVFETLAHLVENRPTVNQAKLLAYRIVTTVCQVSSWGVALPVQMSTITESGASMVDSGELEQLNAEVDGWLAVERSYLVGEASEQPSLDADADVYRHPHELDQSDAS